jgi:hypothetical protein
MFDDSDMVAVPKIGSRWRYHIGRECRVVLVSNLAELCSNRTKLFLS